MFLRAKKLAIAYREKIISLAMLPAFLFASLPYTSCICADGHVEPFCRVALCRLMGQGSPTSCGCSCCQAADACGQRSCCRANKALPKSSDTRQSSGLIAVTDSCCHPFVKQAAPAVASDKVIVQSKSMLFADVLSVGVMSPRVPDATAFERTRHSTPPPFDSVIVYLHLTI